MIKHPDDSNPTVRWLIFLGHLIMNLNSMTKPPVTVEEAVERLMVILDDNEKERIEAMLKDDLIDLHFSLGKGHIRNAFGL